MSFADPFNRLGRKREREYLALHEQLKKAGIDTEEKVKTVLQQSRKRMLGFGAIVVIVAFLVSLIWPDLTGIVIVLSVLILVWLVGTMVRGQRMMQQFIEQEFARKDSESSTL